MSPLPESGVSQVTVMEVGELEKARMLGAGPGSWTATQGGNLLVPNRGTDVPTPGQPPRKRGDFSHCDISRGSTAGWKGGTKFPKEILLPGSLLSRMTLEGYLAFA